MKQPLNSLVQPVPSSTILQGYIDGVVDVEGRQVYKMNENTHLTFDGNLFSIDAIDQSISDATRFKSGNSVGLYRDILRNGGFQHELTREYSKDMFKWWEMAENKD